MSVPHVRLTFWKFIGRKENIMSLSGAMCLFGRLYACTKKKHDKLVVYMSLLKRRFRSLFSYYTLFFFLCRLCSFYLWKICGLYFWKRKKIYREKFVSALQSHGDGESFEYNNTQSPIIIIFFLFQEVAFTLRCIKNEWFRFCWFNEFIRAVNQENYISLYEQPKATHFIICAIIAWNLSLFYEISSFFY